MKLNPTLLNSRSTCQNKSNIKFKANCSPKAILNHSRLIALGGLVLLDLGTIPSQIPPSRHHQAIGFQPIHHVAIPAKKKIELGSSSPSTEDTVYQLDTVHGTPAAGGRPNIDYIKSTYLARPAIGYNDKYAELASRMPESTKEIKLPASHQIYTYQHKPIKS